MWITQVFWNFKLNQPGNWSISFKMFSWIHLNEHRNSRHGVPHVFFFSLQYRPELVIKKFLSAFSLWKVKNVSCGLRTPALGYQWPIWVNVFCGEALRIIPSAINGYYSPERSVITLKTTIAVYSAITKIREFDFQFLS